MKRCRTCGDNQPAAAYHKDASSPDGRRGVCRCCRAEVNRWEKIEARYSLSREGFYELLDSQDGRCAICLTEMPKGEAVVDHCHSTGLVRGLLCASCNTGIGHLRDGRDLTIFDRAKRYLS
jgi:hypothetical protein